MAIRHVKDYYMQVCNQAERMTKVLEQISEEANKTMLSPTNLEAIQKQVDVIKANKARLDYIMYLLNMPNRDQKEKAYEIRNKRFLESVPKNTELTENEDSLNKLSAIEEEVKENEY